MATVDDHEPKTGPPTKVWTVSPARYRSIVVIAAVLLALIIFTGAAVRLTDSGLGCEDWPRCSEDKLVPEWSFHGWVEFGNRLLSGVVAIAVGLAVLTAYRRNPRRRDLIRWAWGLVAGVLVQIILGGITVKVDLHPAFVSSHFLLSALLMWNVLVLHRRASVGSGPPSPAVGPSLVRHSRALVAIAAGVVVTGTLVTGSGPNSGDVRADRLSVDLADIARVHSVMAWLFVAVLVWFLFRLARIRSRFLSVARFLLYITVAQGALGYWQYFTGVPAGLVQMHVIGSIGVWSASVWLHLQLFTRSGRDEAHPVEAELVPATRHTG